MTGTTLTRREMENRIQEAAPGLSRSKCQRLALKMQKRMEADARLRALPADDLIDHGLRVLGIYADPTPREALIGRPALARELAAMEQAA